VVAVFHQSVGFFDDPNQASLGILPLQVSVSDPSLPTLTSATGLISPDHATKHRMAHFDPTLYDMRDESHLVRFVRVLLGDAGAGQLRKRYMMARLQTTLNGTHFYDLDGFYGSILSVQRKVSEQLPINPMSGTATPDEWDDILARDAKYRERIYALAKALPMGATVPGLQQAAEALTGVECDVYETWKMLGSRVSAGRSWDVAESDFGSWDAFETTMETWSSVEDRATIGRAGVGNADEVVIRPKMSYTPVDASEEAAREAERQRQEDEMNVQRVLNILKPAGVLLTVDNLGMVMHVPTRIVTLEADSNFWEVLTKVKPRPGLSTVANPYPLSPVLVSVGSIEAGALTPLPKPPFATSQGHQWSYNSAIASVKGLSIRGDSATVSGSGTVISNKNWERVTWRAKPQPGMPPSTEFLPNRGVSDQRALLAAQASTDSVLQAHPYSGPRVVVPVSG
jgi:hypothetical protein